MEEKHELQVQDIKNSVKKLINNRRDVGSSTFIIILNLIFVQTANFSWQEKLRYGIFQITTYHMNFPVQLIGINFKKIKETFNPLRKSKIKTYFQEEKYQDVDFDKAIRELTMDLNTRNQIKRREWLFLYKPLNYEESFSRLSRIRIPSIYSDSD